MHVYDTYEGNSGEDEELSARLDEEPVETVTVDDDQRRRSRFRATTDAGTDVGVVLGRILRADDVLAVADSDAPLLRITLEPVDAVVVDLADAETDLSAAVALGHAAGNRHWDMAIRGESVLFPATESDERIRETLEPVLPDGAALSRESVSPALFDGESGHGGDAGHRHGHDHSHDHGRTHEHSGQADNHDHDHKHGHDHQIASDLFGFGGDEP